LKYWPSSHGSNKLVIKAKVHAKTFFECFCFMRKKDNIIIFFVIGKYDVMNFFLSLRGLAVCMKTKYIFFGFIIFFAMF
jgi:hypothetical protein